MKLIKSLGILIPILILALTLFSCSRNTSPVEPGADFNAIPDSSATGNRSIIAVYDMTIDPVAQTVEISQSDRTAEYHFPLTSIYPNVVKIAGFGWTPNLWVDIKLSHPFPGSAICGFDPRVIAVLPANNGVSFFYPTINAKANHSVMLDPDGYTKLFDNVGGSIPGNANPFKAYFKGQPYRAWYGKGVTQETQRWNLNIAGFGGPVTYKLVVDVSSNYPNAPQPVIDNCPEPYTIDMEVGSGLTDEGGSATIDVMINDWQGIAGVGGVMVEAPHLFNGIVNLSYLAPGPLPNEYAYQGTITNSKLAPAGDYKFLIATWDSATQVAMLNEFDITVYPKGPYNPMDVTPEWLNFSPIDVCTSGNKLYTVGEEPQGMHIFDITNPTSPQWLGSLKIDEIGLGIDVDGEYAYIAGEEGGLYIIHCDSMDNLHLVKVVDTPSYASSVDYHNGYVYVADQDYDLQIIDVSPPEDAHIAHSVELPDYSMDVFVANDTYAYVATEYEGLSVINISNPEAAYLVNYTGGEDSVSVYVDGNYAYLADGYGGLTIVDISTPTAPVIVKYLEMPETTVDAMAFAGYAYVLGDDDAIYVVDVDPPQSAYIVSQTATTGNARHLTYYLDKLYVAEYGYGIQMYDISTPGTLVNVASMPSLFNIDGLIQVQGDYAFAVGARDECYGLQVIHFNPLESAHIEVVKSTVGYPMDLDLQSGYLYVADLHKGLSVYDVADPANPILAKNVLTTIETEDISVSGGYAYLSNRNTGLTIIDIEPLASAHVDKTFDPSSWDYINDLDSANGYVYLAMWSNGLFIVDAEPPESASVIKQVEAWGGPQGVNVSGDYAYVGGETYFSIVNINPPESAYKVKDLALSDSSMNGMCYSNGYAYLTGSVSYKSTLLILDVDPVNSLSIISSVTLPPSAKDVNVVDNYAFVSSNDSGMRIVKLW